MDSIVVNQLTASMYNGGFDFWVDKCYISAAARVIARPNTPPCLFTLSDHVTFELEQAESDNALSLDFIFNTEPASHSAPHL